MKKMYEQLDNLDKDDAKQVAYFIWLECQHIDEDDVMGTKFHDACYDTYEEFGMTADWNAVWDEIEEYLY